MTNTSKPEVIWECKIGGPVPGEMPNGWDFPMRRAVQAAFLSVAGVDAEFTFSGRGQLTEGERAVVEKRAPTSPASGALPADFEPWLRTVCITAPPPQAYDLAKQAWAQGMKRGAALASPQVAPAPAKLTEDGRFLIWLADRLVFVYGENSNIDFVQATRRIAYALAAPAPVAPTQAQGPSKDARDAARYRALRAQCWWKSELFVVAGGKAAVRLGVDCPNLERLDAAVDALPPEPEGQP